jgi:hypothetical protein
MAITYVGKAAVFGHNSTITGKTPSTALGTILIQSYKFKPSATQIDIDDLSSGTVGRIVANPHETLTLEGIFTSALSSTQIADAKTQAAKTPSIGDILTVTDSEDTEVAGDWVVVDAEKSKEVKSPVSISLTLDRFPDTAAFPTKMS